MKTLNAYLFNELSQEAKDLAIHNFDTDELWDHEFSIEDMTSHLESLGLDNVEIQYSGFWSQGDGLSFTADVSDPELFLEHIGAPRLSEDLTDALDICFWRASHTTCHERSCSSSVNYTFLTEETQTEWDSNINHIAQMIEDWRLKECQRLYSQLERDYECSISRDAVAGHLEVNEYYFLEDGTRVKV